MKFRVAFQNENDIDVETIDTDEDYGPVSDDVLKIIDCVSPITGLETNNDNETAAL